MSRMMEKKVRPVAPVYWLAGAWLVFGLIFPLFRLWALILTAVLSFGVYFIARAACKKKTVMVPAPPPVYNTGDAELDALLTEADKLVVRLYELNARIPDPTLSASIERMSKTGEAILREVASQPQKGRRTRSFLTYYLPTSVKLLDSYAKAYEGGGRGANITAIKAQVEQNAEAIANTFEAQYDNLFAVDAMDITTETIVLDGMIKGDAMRDDASRRGKGEK